jgi:hypothetical protein
VVSSAAIFDGVLTLTNGTTTVAEFHLAGNYAGATFSTQLQSGVTEITVGDVVPSAPDDINGDGTSEILFGQTNGTLAEWLMSGTSIIGGGDIGNPGGTWSFAGIGDYNGDGHAESASDRVVSREGRRRGG